MRDKIIGCYNYIVIGLLILFWALPNCVYSPKYNERVKPFLLRLTDGCN